MQEIKNQEKHKNITNFLFFYTHSSHEGIHFWNINIPLWIIVLSSRSCKTCKCLTSLSSQLFSLLSSAVDRSKTASCLEWCVVYPWYVWTQTVPAWNICCTHGKRTWHVLVTFTVEHQVQRVLDYCCELSVWLSFILTLSCQYVLLSEQKSVGQQISSLFLEKNEVVHMHIIVSMLTCIICQTDAKAANRQTNQPF